MNKQLLDHIRMSCFSDEVSDQSELKVEIIDRPCFERLLCRASGGSVETLEPGRQLE